MDWLPWPGLGCCPVLQGVVPQQLKPVYPVPAVWDGDVGAALPLSFLSYFFRVFFIFIVRQHQAPSTADSQLHFQHLHSLVLLQKEVLSCTLRSSCQDLCLCWCGICVTAQGLGLGHDLAGGLKRQVWICHRWRRVCSVSAVGLFCPAGIVAWECCISIAGSFLTNLNLGMINPHGVVTLSYITGNSCL